MVVNGNLLGENNTNSINKIETSVVSNQINDFDDPNKNILEHVESKNILSKDNKSDETEDDSGCVSNKDSLEDIIENKTNSPTEFIEQLDTNVKSVSDEKLDLQNEESVVASDDRQTQENIESESDVEEFSPSKKHKNKKRFVLDDSDSENEAPIIDEKNVESETIPESLNTVSKKHKRLALLDSDSDPESEIVSKDIASNKKTEIYTTNYKGEMTLENTVEHNTVQKWSALCDSESSEEETEPFENIENTEHLESEDETAAETIIPQPYKKKTKCKSDEKLPKKMTGKDAAELKKEIKSESQRMTREMNVSLPYHRPKQFTLKEFLSRRPKLSSVIPGSSQVPASIAIHMATKQLDIITQKLKERQEQIKEFYKSESESEENDDDKDYVPPSDVQEEINNTINPVDENPVPKLGDQENNSKEITNDFSDSGIVSGDISEGKHSDSNEINDNRNNSSDNSVVSTDIGTSEIDKNNDTVDCNNKVNDSTQDSAKENENTDMEITESSELDTETFKTNSLELEHNLEVSSMEVDKDENVIDKPSTTFQYGELDKEIEEFDAKEDETKEIKLSKVELLKQKLVNIKPRLSGAPDEIIDLETGITEPSEIAKLKQRFVQQAIKRPISKHKVKLNIVSVESGEIHKETVAMNVEDDESSVIEEKPGVRLRKLRDELQNQITQKRLELWQNKSLKSKNEEEEIQELEEGDKPGFETGDDILDDDQEEEMSESSEEEEEIEENDVVEKPKKRSAFVDDEAEVSDPEDDMDELKIDDDNDEEKELEDLNEENEDEQSNAADDVNNEFSSENEDEIEQTVKKPLKRILKGFTEDSDDDDDDDVGKTTLQTEVTEIDKNETTQDYKITPHQEQRSHTPIQNNANTQQKSMEFLTPISYITGLQNLNNSASKNRKDSPISSVFRMPSVPSPLKEMNWQSNLQKKLFNDSEITNSQLEDMETLCSTTFTESQVLEQGATKENENCTQDSELITSSAIPSTQDLLNICSGDFEETPRTNENSNQNLGTSQLVSASALPSTQDLLNICSGDFSAATGEENTLKSNIEQHTLNQINEVKCLDIDQDIISQLIDEEEMEKFKRKFDSPLLTDTQKRIVEEFEEREVAGGGVIDSDDEDELIGIKRKKKHKKKLMFSDDESSEDDDINDQDEEEIDLHDEDDENDEAEDNDIPVDNIGYDSEENEVDLEDDNQVKKTFKASDFFENEAELSESEWGSADEDEKDLDDLEFEQGDAEQYDEKKLRNDLEKIHMRRMLDDDNREVKLLQELLLEDGELHGTGRERQFRWKNIDSMDNEEEPNKGDDDDDVYLDEDESEEQWRRKRYEREMFLKEKERKSQILDEEDNLLSDSQLLRIGHQIIQRSNSNSQQNTPVDNVKEDVVEPLVKSTFSIFNKRGSFLSRGEETLQRLARFNNVTVTTNTETGQTAKNSRKFLFQTVAIEQTTVIKDKKRKAESGTPNVIKKLRLSENFSPANKRKKSAKPSAKTKLFGAVTDVS